jgi:hypothetical protein
MPAFHRAGSAQVQGSERQEATAAPEPRGAPLAIGTRPERASLPLDCRPEGLRLSSGCGQKQCGSRARRDGRGGSHPGKDPQGSARKSEPSCGVRSRGERRTAPGRTRGREERVSPAGDFTAEPHRRQGQRGPHGTVLKFFETRQKFASSSRGVSRRVSMLWATPPRSLRDISLGFTRGSGGK